MYQYQGITLSLGSQPCAHDSLAGARRCDEDADIMFAQGANGLLLNGCEFAIKSYIEWLPGMALVIWLIKL